MSIELAPIDPVIVHLGKISPTWYGFMYALAFVLGYALAIRRMRLYPHLGFSRDQLSDLLFYLMLGVILGGRIGYYCFYRLIPYGFHGFVSDPLAIFRIWEGGMSFHGGLLGVFIACVLYCRKYNKSILSVGDFIAPIIPIGLFFGRIGNFINAELWGKASNLPWACIFPNDPLSIPRHPSQIYEAIWEGLIMFTIMNIYFIRNNGRFTAGREIGLFLSLYAVGRFFIEFVREKDAHMSFYLGMTMGQLLCLPMLFIGLFLIFRKN